MIYPMHQSIISGKREEKQDRESDFESELFMSFERKDKRDEMEVLKSGLSTHSIVRYGPITGVICWYLEVCRYETKKLNSADITKSIFPQPLGLKIYSLYTIYLIIIIYF